MNEIQSTCGYVRLFGHSNGHGNKAKFKSPVGVAVRDEKIYVCDPGDSTIRVVRNI